MIGWLLPVLTFFVFFCAAVLRELNDKEGERANNQEVDHAALVKKERGNNPKYEEQTTGNPKHSWSA